MEEILQYIAKNKLDIIGTFLGFIYLFLEFRTSIWMWVVGCIMPAIYIVVLYQAGIYADCGMEVYYFLAGVYGLVYWLMGKKKTDKKIVVCRTPKNRWSVIIIITVILYIAIAVFLRECTDSKIPNIDAFTTALSVMAMWMLSRKYIEQWVVWFVVDAVSTGLYIYKGVYGRSLLYGIYTLMALYGYYSWWKKMKKSKQLYVIQNSRECQ